MKKGSESYSKSEAERYIKDRSRAWAESVATSDPAVVKEILADDFVWVLDGNVLDKSRAVMRVHEGLGDFLSNHLDYAEVRFFDDTAVAQGSETWTRKGGHKGHSVWIDTWIRRNGTWQIVAAADVSVPIKE